MEMDFGHCWDCPLDLSTALGIAVAGLPLLFLAVRLYSSRSTPVKFLGGCAAGLTFFVLGGVAKYVGTHGLSVSRGAVDLPFYTRFLFLGGLLLVSTAVFYLGRRRSPPSDTSPR